MNKVHIKKNTIQETLVISLYARKMCTEYFPDLYCDYKSVELIDRLDYDFSELYKKAESKMQQFGFLEIAMRQNDLAIEVRNYLKSHPNASIVNLGCGLDQTAENNAGSSNKIYNIDMPDVINVRNELLPENNQIRNIGIDLNDTAWFDEIDDSHGVIFIAAGVFYYFKKTQIQALFNSMAARFRGGALAFDTANKSAVKLMLKTWVRDAGITDIDSYFYVNDMDSGINSWLKNAKASYKGYMLGYNDLQTKSVSGLDRFLAKVGDKIMKMRIVRIDFE